MKSCDLKIGKAVTVGWKKKDGLVFGRTEGVVLGVTGDKVSGEYLVIDKSTYQNSLKSVLFSLGIMDLETIPLAEVESTKTTELRKRPPGIHEKLKCKMEIDYKSNVDSDETFRKIQQRTDCRVEPNQPGHTDGSCGFTILDISEIEDAKIGISPMGNVQFHCFPLRFTKCLEWFQRVAEVFPDQSRLVLIPTHFMFNVHDLFEGDAYPTEEVIDRIAKTEGRHPFILPLGWVHEFFGELDKNPLQRLFLDSEKIEDDVLIREKKRRTNVKPKEKSSTTKIPSSMSIVLPQRQVSVNRYLGANPQTFRVTGKIGSLKDEEDLIRLWLETRSSPWEWLTLNDWQGKTIVRDLTIDRKTGVYTIEFCKYYDSENSKMFNQKE